MSPWFSSEKKKEEDNFCFQLKEILRFTVENCNPREAHPSSDNYSEIAEHLSIITKNEIDHYRKSTSRFG